MGLLQAAERHVFVCIHSICAKYLTDCCREDSDENNLKASAYEAINEFMQSAEGAECMQVIQALVPIFITRFEATFNVQVCVYIL